MQNSPTVIAAQPPLPLPLPPPPHSAGQITVFPLPPPPPFTGAPNSVFQITVLPGPPPPFPGPPSTVDLNPLEFLLALVAIVTIPALIYTFIFAFPCPLFRRRESHASEPSIASEVPHHDVESVTSSASGVKYQKEAHVKEIGGECAVCLSVFADGEEVRQLSACKHSFHASCIDMWLSNHSNCPICRATITANATATVKRSDSNRDGHLQQGQSDRDRDAPNLV
ncbi:hypothetical protein VNO77_19469 [Canavalia gladiata]|uniref:RING-type domain-containing protein n=1 Tax=Canavalia gladiata TaxID=3824 RepID=A0AAN9LMU1_CANGL